MQQDFDHIASQYDQDFTHSLIGKAQRNLVWKHLTPIAPNSQILELNCGTGEDAFQLSQQGHVVLATDIAEQMVQVANSKLMGTNSSARVLDMAKMSFEELHGKDLVFSNFGGLNCLSPNEWQDFAHTLQIGLEKQARLVMVIMSKNCLWEKIYFALRPKNKWRRNGQMPVEAHVDGTLVKTWYYSPKEIAKFLGNDYQLIKTKPIGFFIPPSYLEGFFKRNAFLFNGLKILDNWVSSWSFLSNYADHFYIEFKKKNG